MPESALPTDPVPEDQPELTMKEFMTQQRAVIYSDLQQHRLTLAYSQAMIERLTDSLNLIDDWFTELAQPVEPGVDTIDTTLLGDGRGVQS